MNSNSSFSLTDQEIDEKLASFTGASGELDKANEKVVGKLLVNFYEEKTERNNWKAYIRLYNMAGGFSIIFLLVLCAIFFKFLEVYRQSVSQSWADSSPEDQSRYYFENMTTITYISFGTLILRTIKDHVFQIRRKEIGRDIHKETLKKILHAPVNNFFDVTPIGKIMTIFSEDLPVFYGRILEAPMRMMSMISHTLVVFSLMFAIGDWFLVPCLALMVLLMHWVSKPYLQADN